MKHDEDFETSLTETCVCGKVCAVRYYKEHSIHCVVRRQRDAAITYREREQTRARKKRAATHNGVLRTKASQETIDNFLVGDG